MHRIRFAVGKDFIGYLGDEEIQSCKQTAQSNRFPMLSKERRTYYQTLHLVLPQNLHIKRILDLVVELERAAAGRHDAQFRRFRAILLLVLYAQLSHEIYTCIYLVRLEFEEVETATELLLFAGKVDELG